MPRSGSRTARRTILLAALLSLAAAAGHAQAESTADLIDAPGSVLVRANCSVCHSLRLVTAQRGDAAFWLNTIRWMQRTQNLWPLPEAQERAIVDYLAAHYDETDWGRRPPLSPALLPPATSPP